MRPFSKINWSDENWREYIQEPLNIIGNLKDLGALEAADLCVDWWEKVAIERENEYKNFNRPAIPYQE